MATTRKPRRRLLALSVGEVSIVDAGANEEPYHVVKNKDGEMADTKIKNEQAEGRIAEAEVAKATEAEPKAGAERTEPKAQEADGGADLKELVSTVKALEEQNKALAAEVEALKRSNAPVEFTVTSDGVVKVDGEAVEVEKAKTFTQARVSALSNAVGGLFNMLNEASPDSARTFIESAAKELGIGLVAGSAPEGDVSVTKSEESELASVRKALEESQAAVKRLSERLEAVEKARAPSKSAQASEEASEGKVETKKSFWGGLL